MIQVMGFQNPCSEMPKIAERIAYWDRLRRERTGE